TPLIEKIRDTLSESKIARLKPDVQKKVRQIRPPNDLRPPKFEDIPDAMRLPMVLKNGDLGRVALIFPKPLGPLSGQNLGRIDKLVYDAIHKGGEQANAVGRPLLFWDISKTILDDGPLSTAVSFALVCILVAVVLRSPRPVVQVLASLVVGVIW